MISFYFRLKNCIKEGMQALFDQATCRGALEGQGSLHASSAVKLKYRSLSVPTARRKELLGNNSRRNRRDFPERAWCLNSVRIEDLLTLLP